MMQSTSRSPQRRSIDLSGYPDLVVVYLGYRVSGWRSLVGLFGIGRGMRQIEIARPDGLLANEYLVYGLRHVGMRQYWRDLPSLEAFTRSEPHGAWWRDFLRDNRGAGFWHETYRIAGGMEAVYLSMPNPIGFAAFAPDRQPTGPFMTSRQRLAA